MRRPPPQRGEDDAAPPPRWPPGPGDPRLAAGEVHVWILPLDRSDADRERLRAHLSPSELQRVARLHRPIDRRRRIAHRGLVRELLARYLDAPAGDLEFFEGPHGKPALGHPWIGAGLHFNLSRAGGLGLFAVARDVEIGVDLERIRPLTELEDLASRFFARGEAGRLLALPPALRVDAFYRAWTRKEAFVKALGEGLHRSLSSFEVSLDPDRPARLLRFDGPDTPDRWRIVHLAPAAGHVGALALPGPPERVARWRA